jgi:NhaB family Na+:H+ antiporter
VMTIVGLLGVEYLLVPITEWMMQSGWISLPHLATEVSITH